MSSRPFWATCDGPLLCDWYGLVRGVLCPVEANPVIVSSTCGPCLWVLHQFTLWLLA